MSKKIIILLLSMGFFGCASVPTVNLQAAQKQKSVQEPQEGKAGVFV